LNLSYIEQYQKSETIKRKTAAGYNIKDQIMRSARRGALGAVAASKLAGPDFQAHTPYSRTPKMQYVRTPEGLVAGLLSNRSKASSKFKPQQGPLHITDIVSDGAISKRHWSMQDIKKHS